MAAYSLRKLGIRRCYACVIVGVFVCFFLSPTAFFLLILVSRALHSYFRMLLRLCLDSIIPKSETPKVLRVQKITLLYGPSHVCRRLRPSWAEFQAAG